MKILIAGCGDIGSKVGRHMHLCGHRVYGLKRNTDTIASPIIPICADLSRPLSAETLPDDLDQVIYIVSAAGFNEMAYQNAYINGVKHLVQGLGQTLTRLKRFIFVSSTSVFGQNSGEWVDEESVTEPVAFNGQIMLEAEKQVLELPDSMVVRFSGIYGEGRQRMLNQVRAGKIAARQPVIYSNRIHSDDCAGVLQHFSQMHDLKYRLVLASDNRPAALHEIQQWLADQLAVPENQRIYEVPTRRAGSKRISNQRLIEAGYRLMFEDYQAGYGKLL